MAHLAALSVISLLNCIDLYDLVLINVQILTLMMVNGNFQDHLCLKHDSSLVQKNSSRKVVIKSSYTNHFHDQNRLALDLLQLFYWKYYSVVMTFNNMILNRPHSRLNFSSIFSFSIENIKFSVTMISQIKYI